MTKNTFIRSASIALLLSLAIGLSLIPTAMATTTTGHVRHEMRDMTTGILTGRLDYYTTLISHYSGGKYLNDESWDSVSVSHLAFGHFYDNIVHSVTDYYGSSDEYVRGDCEWDNGFGIPTPWGWVILQQWHHTCHIWVYGSGYWTWEFI